MAAYDTISMEADEIKNALDYMHEEAELYQPKGMYPKEHKIFNTIRAALQSPRVPEPTSIENVAMEDTWLREKIGIALGEASMCWSEIPTGVFHSERATEILNDLCCQINTRKSPRVPVIEILETVLEQAEDEGLWFNAKYASEAYLQQELRRLHAVIERAYAELSKTQEPSLAPPQKGV